MSHIGMDPDHLGRHLLEHDINWLWDLHRRVSSLIPPVLLRLYEPEGPTTEEEVSLLALLHNFDSTTDRTTLLNNIMVPYRERGFILTIMQDFDHLITRPIQLSVGFAVPSDASLNKIKSLDRPIVQVGAGAAYWAAILRQRVGVDVVAFDIHPPSNNDDVPNAFFDVAYTDDIIAGACTDVFYGEAGIKLAQARSLLLVWPNDPDPVDNQQFASSGSEAVWDADCLAAYIQSGGSQVIYVGEREDTIHLSSQGASPDCGISSTRRFQTMLRDEFSLMDTVEIPNWWLNEDDMTIWNRN
jgi:hypothetical protein